MARRSKTGVKLDSDLYITSPKSDISGYSDNNSNNNPNTPMNREYKGKVNSMMKRMRELMVSKNSSSLKLAVADESDIDISDNGGLTPLHGSLSH